MFKIKNLTKFNSNTCFNLISKNKKDLSNFLKLGWSQKQFNLQFNKNINFSLGYYNNSNLLAFILGDLITIEKKSEYEILIIYVNSQYRNLNYATKLINGINFFLKDIELKKIYLEVAENNKPAINLYKKTNFNIVGKRKKYYVIDDIKTDALIFNKLINH